MADSSYASEVANQLGLNGDFVRQMSAMTGISNTDIYNAGVTATKNGDFGATAQNTGNAFPGLPDFLSNILGAAGEATGGTQTPQIPNAQANSANSAIDSFLAKFGADTAAVVIGLILIAAAVWKMV